MRVHSSPVPLSMTRSTLISELKACSVSRNLQKGKSIHEAAIQRGEDSDLFVASTLINMYAKCGSIDDARAVFEKLRHRDAVTWNTLILGYADNGQGAAALDLFLAMRQDGCEAEGRTFLGALKACIDLAERADAKLGFIQTARKLHLLILRSGCDSDHFVQCTLVDMYAKCRTLPDASKVFEQMSKRDVASWTALILGYADDGQSEVSLELFSRMRREGCVPDARAFVSALKACADLAARDDKESKLQCLEQGKEMHALAAKCGCASDLYVQCTLLDMYSKCGSLEQAREVFESMRNRDTVAWTALILGYADNGQGGMSLDLFFRMRCEGYLPLARTLVAVLKACTSLALEVGADKVALSERGKAVHFLASSSGYDSDMYVQNSLVGMYANCGSMLDARTLFDNMLNRTVVSWNALILGYVENEESTKGLECFCKMRDEFMPDERTYLAALNACSDIGMREGGSEKQEAGEKGKVLHLLASSSGADLDFYVQSSLVDMYAKCGMMEEARSLFKGMDYRDVVTWTALIFGYADKGEGEVALNLFSTMRREGYEPDVRALAAALKACGLLGALEFGKSIYGEICSRGFKHDAILVTCVVDFYARCGNLLEAKQMFDSHGVKELIACNALMTGYSRQGDTEAVFDLMDRMQDAGLEPGAVNFLCVLTTCSHAGLVEKGKFYFEAMSRTYGIHPGIEHYTCMVDTFARSNMLEDAMAFVRDMRISPDAVIWKTLMGACRKWKAVDLGKFAFESVLSFEDHNAVNYVSMANIYGTKDRQAAVQRTSTLEHSWWTNEAGVVHTFSQPSRT